MPTTRELGLDRLPAEERLALADELYGSLPESGESLSARRRADLAERVAEYHADPAAGSGVDEVRSRLLGRRP